jgi:hypothetical protein
MEGGFCSASRRKETLMLVLFSLLISDHLEDTLKMMKPATTRFGLQLWQLRQTPIEGNGDGIIYLIRIR